MFCLGAYAFWARNKHFCLMFVGFHHLNQILNFLYFLKMLGPFSPYEILNCSLAMRQLFRSKIPKFICGLILEVSILGWFCNCLDGGRELISYGEVRVEDFTESHPRVCLFPALSGPGWMKGREWWADSESGGLGSSLTSATGAVWTQADIPVLNICSSL